MSEKTALLLVDVLDGFFAPTGSMYYEGVTAAVEPLRRLLEEARRRDTLLVHAVERHRPGLDDFEQRHLPEHCIAGGPDGRYFAGFEPVQRDREIEVPKRRYSAFFATDLALLLHEQRIEDVVVAGVKTNVCIRATIQDAFASGFRVCLPREATNSNRPHLAEASLEDIDRYFGSVVDLDDALDLL